MQPEGQLPQGQQPFWAEGFAYHPFSGGSGGAGAGFGAAGWPPGAPQPAVPPQLPGPEPMLFTLQQAQGGYPQQLQGPMAPLQPQQMLGSGLQGFQPLGMWQLGGGGTLGAPAPLPPAARMPTQRPVTCQVPGCTADLSGLKDYYSRYKICVVHCQMHSIVRQGVPQRFCQQCGRFQPLEDFDGEKRTCRRKLERHNARRRKKPGGSGVRQGAATKQQRRPEPAPPAAPAAAAAAAGLWPAAGAGGAGMEGAGGLPGSVESGLVRDRALEALAAELDMDISPLEDLAPFQLASAVQPAQQEQQAQQAQQHGQQQQQQPRLPSWHSAPAHFWAPASRAMPTSPGQHPLVLGAGGGGSLPVLGRPSTRLPPLASMGPAGVGDSAAAAAAPSPMALASTPLGRAGEAWPGELGAAGTAWGAGGVAESPDVFQSMLAELLGPPEGSSLAALEEPSPLPPPPSRLLPALSAPPPLLGPPAAPAAEQGGAEEVVGESPTRGPLEAAAVAAAASHPAPQITPNTVPGPGGMPTAFGQQPYASPLPQQQGPAPDRPSFAVLLQRAPAAISLVPAAPKAEWEPQAASQGPVGSSGLGPAAAPPAQQAQQQEGSVASWPGPQQAQQGRQAPTPDSFRSSLEMIQAAQAEAQYFSQDPMYRLSIKLFGLAPEALPTELRGDLATLLEASPGFVDSHLRPGCIHIALSGLRLEGVAGHSDIRTAIQALLQLPQAEQLHGALCMVQLGDELAVVEGGQVRQVFRLSQCQGILPHISSISPLCLPATGPGRVLVRGRGILGPPQQIYCRHNGGYPLLEVHSMGRVPASTSGGYGYGTGVDDGVGTVVSATVASGRGGADGADGYIGSAQAIAGAAAGGTYLSNNNPGSSSSSDEAGSGGWGGEWEEWMEVALPGAKSQGLYQLEVQRGALLGNAKPLLVLEDPQAVAELRQLEASPAGIGDVDGFLEGLGVVVRYLSAPKPTSSAGASSLSPPSPSRAPTAAQLPAGLSPDSAVAASSLGLGACVPSRAPTWPEAKPLLAESSDEARVARIACSLAVCCVTRGWPALTRMLLPVAAAGRSASATVAALDSACPAGRTLLHLAVSSRSPEVLKVLGAWGREAGHAWALAAPGGPCGITPLHLVAAIRCPLLLKALAGLDPQGFASAWTSALTADGYTPAAFATLALCSRQPSPVNPPQPVRLVASAAQQGGAQEGDEATSDAAAPADSMAAAAKPASSPPDAEPLSPALLPAPEPVPSGNNSSAAAGAAPATPAPGEALPLARTPAGPRPTAAGRLGSHAAATRSRGGSAGGAGAGVTKAGGAQEGRHGPMALPGGPPTPVRSLPLRSASAASASSASGSSGSQGSSRSSFDGTPALAEGKAGAGGLQAVRATPEPAGGATGKGAGEAVVPAGAGKVWSWWADLDAESESMADSEEEELVQSLRAFLGPEGQQAAAALLRERDGLGLGG